MSSRRARYLVAIILLVGAGPSASAGVFTPGTRWLAANNHPEATRAQKKLLRQLSATHPTDGFGRVWQRMRGDRDLANHLSGDLTTLGNAAKSQRVRTGGGEFRFVRISPVLGLLPTGGVVGVTSTPTGIHTLVMPDYLGPRIGQETAEHLTREIRSQVEKLRSGEDVSVQVGSWAL